MKMKPKQKPVYVWVARDKVGRYAPQSYRAFGSKPFQLKFKSGEVHFMNPDSDLKLLKEGQCKLFQLVEVKQ